MKLNIATACYAIQALLGLAISAHAAEKFTAKNFAGTNWKLDRQEAAFYIVYRDKEPLSKFMVPGQMTLDPKKVVAAMGDKLDDLRSKTGHGAPWTWQELDARFPAKMTERDKDAALPEWKKIEGFTIEKKLGEDGASGSLGPFRLRKSAEDLTKKLKDSRGATVGFSNDRSVGGGGVWNTEGALDYPIKLIRQGGLGESTELEIGPAIEWKLAQVQGVPKRDVEELTFSLPTTIYASPGGRKMTGTYEENIVNAGIKNYSALWVIQGKPYFQTDFSGGYEIYGAEASAEFVGNLFGSPIVLGGFHNMGTSGLQYQLRVIPKLDFSTTERVGVHTTRKEGDDWMRAGATVSLDFRLGGEVFNPLDIGVSYQFLGALSGSGNYSELFKPHATWWLSESAGLTLEYSKGDTPVADKSIDLLTLGLEFKY